MSYTEYDLAKRLRGRSPTRAVELAEVLAVEPLKIKIGNGEYEQGRTSGPSMSPGLRIAMQRSRTWSTRVGSILAPV